MAQLTIQRAFELAVQHHQAGRLRQAGQIYRQILAQQPNHPEALHYLALVALRDRGTLDEAIAGFKQAIALRPDYAEAHNHLGIALKEKGQRDEAIAACRRAIALRPDHAEAYMNLASGLKANGQLDEAIAACRQAVVLNPNLYGAHSNLGNVLKDKGLFDDAIAAYQLAIAREPAFAEAYINLGHVLREKGQLDEAIAACRRAITLNPRLHGAYVNLGGALKAQGQLDEAIAAFRQAVALRPDFAQADSNLLYTMLYHPAYDARTIADEHRRWDRQHAARLNSPAPSTSSGPAYCNDRSPGRRLRIGYVSPDFREHAVGRNLLPLFQRHDRQQFDITCYAQVHRPDGMTRQFQESADGWHNIVGLSDEQVAKQIQGDQIDILVDLALHTASNRLLVFARKPAPVQATFGGYPGSTGLSAIDYRLSDPYLDPPGTDETVYSERTIRLPDSFWCYDPLDCREIPVNSLPALETGAVTFGCLNNFCKINDAVLTLWAAVLRQVENSRLLLLAPPGSHRQRTLQRLSEEGIDASRVEFIAHQSRPAYLKTYDRIDLGLDSFPYNGHTTSLDSFWMGVPVVTLVGQRAVSRAGWCQASNLGLGELARQSAAEFVQCAVDLAKNLPRLKEMRTTLRRRMEQSPLLDAPKFARGIEAAYREMWRTWRATESDRRCPA